MASEHGHPHGHAHPHDLPGRAPSPAPGAHDTAQESLVRALRHSFNILRILMLVLVVLYLSSGVFKVDPGQQGLVSRFGALLSHQTEEGESKVFGPGWHYQLPDPFDKKYLISGQLQNLRITSFVFNHPEVETGKLADIIMQSGELTPGIDGAMFTGDRNLSHGRWDVEYQIADAAQFVENVGAGPGDARKMLQRLTESAVVQEVSGRTIEQVTRTALDDVRARVQARLQKALDDLQTGIRVVQVKAETIEPGAVRPAFLDVIRAENERLTRQEQAQEEATAILSQAAGGKYQELLKLINEYGDAQLRELPEDELAARLAVINAKLDEAKRDGAGQLAVLLSAAESAANEVHETTQREYDHYLALREQRAARPVITELGLWVQMRRAILGNRLNEVFYVPDAREIEVHVKSDPQRKLELEEEAAKRKNQQPTR
jgi:membrane protease subunit HflK